MYCIIVVIWHIIFDAYPFPSLLIQTRGVGKRLALILDEPKPRIC